MVTKLPRGKTGPGAEEVYFSNAKSIFLEKNLSEKLMHKHKRSFPFIFKVTLREGPSHLAVFVSFQAEGSECGLPFTEEVSTSSRP